ncbi:MAG: hypothetical protein FJ197_10210 [Gammaproteobacteria bacterium]|nr:hypothetical protein [Gammaproteobacteria bacterium]
MTSTRRRGAFRRLSLGLGLLGAARLAAGAYADDVGFTKLQQELGAGTPTGAGVVVSQVEAAVTVKGQLTWYPDIGNVQFAGKTITDVSNAPDGIYSGHATSVGTVFYGNTGSVAPAIDTIASYYASTWLGGEFLWATGVQRPDSSASRIVNHSWVGDGTTSNAEIHARVDWVVENDDQLHVTGMNNNIGANTRPLMGNSYNVLAIGRSDGLHQTGSFAVDAVYTGTRAKPDLVVPAGSTSNAAPGASAIAALLVQTGHGNPSLSVSPAYTNRAGLSIYNAERTEVLRAALMAGAERVTRNTSTANLGIYRDVAGNQTANGLDRRYGAGQVNAYNSYQMIAAGERNSSEDGGGSAGARGFDYDPAFGGSAGSNTTATYPLPAATGPQLLTASLVWNLEIHGGTQNTFNATATYRDLNLSLIDTANDNGVVASSQSTIDGTENLWLVVPAGAQYALRVSRAVATNFNYDFAIAWQLLTDTDGDGAHDGQDNCIGRVNGPILRDRSGFSQRDSDNDGYGNVCDADLDNNGTVNAADLNIFRAAFGSANAAADLDGSGFVNAADLNIFRSLFGFAPGPSAYAP